MMIQTIDDLMKDKWTAAIVCNQWGDTGKGKFVDFLAAAWADIIARGTGGANAGHTIIINGQKYVFHIMPSGILHDSEGKINVIGNGVAFDPRVVEEEVLTLDNNNQSYNNLMVAQNAKLMLPQHILLDILAANGRIGTTTRGIGPLYEDHVGRRGLFVNDMLNKDIFESKLKENLEHHLRFIKSFDPALVKNAMMHERMENGLYYSNEATVFNVDALMERYMNHGKLFGNFIRDTDSFIRENHGKKRILAEGAQGLLLSIDHGGYPYVTSSDCSIQGLSKGIGLDTKDFDMVLGIVKFYITRVGKGPFPAEYGGVHSAEWCDNANKKVEKIFTDAARTYSDESINSPNEFVKGMFIRVEGDEYGATTGRPRRTGRLDLPLLRHAIRINGPNVILTKADVLNYIDNIEICDEYEYTGEDYKLGNRIVKKGDRFDTAVMDNQLMNNFKPIYSKHLGWKSDISDARSYDELPYEFKEIISYVERNTGASIKIISTGADRNSTIIR